jgi:hypothetical protein
MLRVQQKKRIKRLNEFSMRSLFRKLAALVTKHVQKALYVRIVIPWCNRRMTFSCSHGGGGQRRGPAQKTQYLLISNTMVLVHVCAVQRGVHFGVKHRQGSHGAHEHFWETHEHTGQAALYGHVYDKRMIPLI